MLVTGLFVSILASSTLEVGPGRAFTRIEDAVAQAKAGDTISVFPDPAGYPKTALRITTPAVTIRGVGAKPVLIKGDGFDYSGKGSVPRAIIQVDPEGEGVKIQNLDLSGAHNESYNGAGVRVQAANKVTISNCIIHDNDMGIMSNGQSENPNAGADQLIEYSLIHSNGNQKDPGYNHNLYLGGTSVKLLGCEIRNSTTGHNVKSRAHFILIQSCWIHDASNREIDLPEAWDTSRPNSNAVLINNRIVKDPKCMGNRGVIHYGQEKGTRVGNLYMIQNTIVTPFASPVVTVTSKGSSIFASCNLFLNLEQGRASLWTGHDRVGANDNLLSVGYGTLAGNTTGTRRSDVFGHPGPEYAFTGALSGKSAKVSWVDGSGNVVVRTGLATHGSNVRDFGPHGR